MAEAASQTLSDRAVTHDGAEAPRYRWVIVFTAAAMLAVAMGQLVNGLSVFFIPLEEEFLWARGSIAMINTVGLVGLAIGGIVMGGVADRVAPQRVCLFGAVVTGACVLAAAWADALWQFYLLFFIAGAFGAGALFAPLIALVGKWFPQGAGLAIGIAAAGQAVGQGGVPFGAAFLIEALGWRGAFMVLGLGTLAVLVPLALLLREPPARSARVAGGGREASVPLPTSIVVPWLSLAVFLCCTCMAVPLMHLVPLAQGCGIPAPEAGSVLFAMMVTAIVGRVAFGRFADMIGAIPAYMTASLWQTALVFFFTQVGDLETLRIFAPVYGFGYAGVMTGVLVTTHALIPASRRASATGVIIAFAWLGHGFGGYQGGLFYDLTGGYTISFANAAIAGIFNLAVVGSLFFVIWRRRLRLTAA